MRLLVAPDAFAPSLGAAAAAAAIGRGVEAAGLEPPDLCPVSADALPADVDARMRAAFALVVGEGTFDRGTLEGRPAGELAVRARQAGVPCHAIVGRDLLDPFGKRILDVQHVLEAATIGALERAGEQLARRLLTDVMPG